MTPPQTALAIVFGLGLLVSACADDATSSAGDSAAATDQENSAMGNEPQAMGQEPEAMGEEPAAGEGVLAVAALDHAILLVSDLDAQSAFYAELLGWQQIAEGDRNRLGVVGGVGLNLVVADGDAPDAEATDAEATGTNASGVDALGFRTTDIDGAEAALTDAGLAFERNEFPLPDGRTNDVLSFADPEGNTVNLVQPRS